MEVQMDPTKEIIVTEPDCIMCGKTMRYVAEVNLDKLMVKGLNASLTLSDKSAVKMYYCEKCRKIEFYMP